MESFERQLQELIDDFVQEVEEIEQTPSCNGPIKSLKLVVFSSFLGAWLFGLATCYVYVTELP